jgi:undecaprenyl-diphosphatase
MLDITALGGTAVLTLITAGVIGFLLMDGKRGAALFVLVAVAGGSLLTTLAKLAFARPRPELVAHLVEVSSYSFPSGHAMSSAVTYLTLGALLARTQARKRIKAYLLGVAVVLTLMIGTSRVYLGVHYPSDVLAGWSLGAAWAMLCWQVERLLQQRGQVERED